MAQAHRVQLMSVQAAGTEGREFMGVVVAGVANNIPIDPGQTPPSPESVGTHSEWFNGSGGGFGRRGHSARGSRAHQLATPSSNRTAEPQPSPANTAWSGNDKPKPNIAGKHSSVGRAV